MKQVWEGFMDVAVRNDPGVTVSYRSGSFVFEEGLRDGRWVALYYNAAGFMGAANPKPAPYCLNYNSIPANESFGLVVDGQSLNCGWEYEKCDIDRSEGRIRVRISLRHGLRPVRVLIHTVLDGTAALTRWIEVKNLHDAPAAVSAYAPLCGGCQSMENDFGLNQFRDRREGIWRVGYFADSAQLMEGNFKWMDLPEGGFSIYGRYRRDRFRHPMFMLENRLSGEILMAQFAWSGGYAFRFDCCAEHNYNPTLSYEIALDSASPLYVIDPMGSWAGPEVHFAMTMGGLDEAVNNMNRHIRRVVHPKKEGLREPIVSGHGGEMDMSYAGTLKAIDFAASIGAELFFIDAGWYNDEVGFEWRDWFDYAGDWEFSKAHYPNGIAEIAGICHAKNMKFGVWMEPERFGKRSKMYQTHPEWILKGYDLKPNEGGCLDLGIPECAEWVEMQISRLIENNRLDFFRLDWNPGWHFTRGVREKHGFYENNYVRALDNLYRIYENLRRRFPDVIFENCASGGARTDLGLTKHFTHTWVTDFQIHPNAFRITNGMTMALPPEHITRMLGGQLSYVKGDLRTHLRNLMFTQLSVCGIRPGDAAENSWHMAEIRRYMELYRSFVRPMLPDCDVYHHTPELPGMPPQGFGILELDAHEGDRGMIGVFRLCDPCGEEAVVRPRGLDASRSYRVRYDNSGAECIMDGWRLVNEGIRVRLYGALTSELVLYEAV